MAFETTTFTADVNKTVTVEGIIYNLIPSNIPEGTHIYLNEVELQNDVPVEITADMHLTVTVPTFTAPKITFTTDSLKAATLNGNPIVNGTTYTLEDGSENTVEVSGATSIPQVTVNGDGVTGFTVNNVEYGVGNLPYTFQPTAGITNQVFFKGEAGAPHTFTLAGTDIETVTVNGQQVTLPYFTAIDQDLTVAVAGEIFQLDIESTPGCTIKNSKTGEIISAGTSPVHKVIDIDRDTYLSMDGTHTLTVTGKDVKEISINGVKYPIESLPVSVKNQQMTATVEITGYEPSEVHVVGQYIETVTVDGVDVPIADSGSVDLELTTREENHFINIIGSQPREYALTFNDNGTTVIEKDGTKVQNEVQYLISKDTYIDAISKPIPIHIESGPTISVEVNGRDYTSNDFTINVQQETELDITAETCDLTIDYGDNSFTITVPQNVITITAAHRDGWIFDTWSSSNVGILSPKEVRTQLDLRGKNKANVVCHYQRCVTWDKPNVWN